MEVSALKYSGGIGLHGRSPLLRLQSDERLVALIRRGNAAAFEVLVARYGSRLLSFCRHLLGSREDAEDVLQEVMTAAFNAMIADERPINVRPWLYRIARNRCLNHLRRNQAVGVDSMDVHLSDNGASTADKVHDREAFRLLVGDIHELPETQKTALVLREMDALSYEQIAEAMETTVPSVKSLLVRARVSLAEAAEARLLSCEEVRIELGEIAEGLRRRPTPLVRRHLGACQRCESLRVQLKQTNRALAALLPVGPLFLLKRLIFTHITHGAGSGATAAGSSAAGSAGSGAAVAGTAAAGSSLVAGSSAGGFVSAGIGAVATKAAAGLAAAAIVTAGAVEVDHSGGHTRPAAPHAALPQTIQSMPAPVPTSRTLQPETTHGPIPAGNAAERRRQAPEKTKRRHATPGTALTASTTVKPHAADPTAQTGTTTTNKTDTVAGRTQSQTDTTVLPTTTGTTTTSAVASIEPATTTTPALQTASAPAGTDTTTSTPTSTTTTTASQTTSTPASTGTTTTPPPPPIGTGTGTGTGTTTTPPPPPTGTTTTPAPPPTGTGTTSPPLPAP